MGIERAVARSNENLVVSTAGGARAVFRRYRPLPEPHTSLARLRRERWALETLGAAGVPVARPLAACEQPGGEGLLLQFAEGELLGNLARSLPASDSDVAWEADVRGVDWVALSVPLAEGFVLRLLDRPTTLRDHVERALAETV